ncbi:MAG: BamA/TamA family outer membrane protein [Nannocystaceae bacterium]
MLASAVALLGLTIGGLSAVGEGEPEASDEDTSSAATIPANVVPEGSAIPEGAYLVGMPPTRSPIPDIDVRDRLPRSTRRRHLVLPAPTVRTQPLVGLMIGLGLTYAYRPTPAAVNRVFLNAHARISLRRVHEHGFRLSFADWLGRGEIFEIVGSVRLDPVFPFYGFDPRLVLDDRSIADPHFLNRVNTYALSFTYQHPIWRAGPDGPARVRGSLRGLVGLSYALDQVQIERPDALLAAEMPGAIGLTRRGGIKVGLVWDRRDNTWSPRWGGLHSAIIETGGPWTGSSIGSWARVNVALRWYRHLFFRDLVLANALIVDALVGDVALVPLGQIGGLSDVDAIGGRDLGRGYIHRRFIGRNKAIYSMELRFEPFELKVRRHVVGAGFKLFADIGRVFRGGETVFDNNRVTGGPGAYVAIDRFSLIRFDAGFSSEMVAFYVTGEHSF